MQKYDGTNKSCCSIKAELIDKDDTGRVTPISETNGYFKTINKMLHFVSFHK